MEVLEPVNNPFQGQTAPGLSVPVDSLGAVKAKASKLAFRPGSTYKLLQALIEEGFLDVPVSSAALVGRITEKFGQRIKTTHIHPYMKRFMEAGIVHGFKHAGVQYWVLTAVSKKDGLLKVGTARGVAEIENQLFSPQLTKRLNKDFQFELAELHDNFGRNGNCTAFLLRKILEKLLIIVLAKNNKVQMIEDPLRPGGWKGLKDMIELAAREKNNGLPFLSGKTANEIKGIKFLGDTAAHNPMVGVDNNTILPQMPFIITAYEELARCL